MFSFKCRTNFVVGKGSMSNPISHVGDFVQVKVFIHNSMITKWGKICQQIILLQAKYHKILSMSVGNNPRMEALEHGQHSYITEVIHCLNFPKLFSVALLGNERKEYKQNRPMNERKLGKT